MADKYGGRSAGIRETNNQNQGRSGGATPKKPGPAKAGGSTKGNPTSGGGIFRATKG